MLQSVYRQLADAYVKPAIIKRIRKPGQVQADERFPDCGRESGKDYQSYKTARIQKQACLAESKPGKQLAIQQSQIERQKIMGNISIAGLVAVIGLAIIVYIRFREKGN